MLYQKVVHRWIHKKADTVVGGVVVEYFREHGYVTLHGTGSIREVTAALAQSVLRRMPGPKAVPKVKGFLKAFSFHWSNAQRAWSVIGVREFPWDIDGAEFVVFVGADAMSPLGKIWSLVEMQYVAKALPEHPGFANSVEGLGGRRLAKDLP